MRILFAMTTTHTEPETRELRTALDKVTHRTLKEMAFQHDVSYANLLLLFTRLYGKNLSKDLKGGREMIMKKYLQKA